MNRLQRLLNQPPSTIRPKPSITIIHACDDLPKGWYEAFRSFTSCADSPLSIEYILVIDHARYKDLGPFAWIFRRHDDGITNSDAVGSFKIALNRGPSTDESRIQVGMKHASPDTTRITINDDSLPHSVSWDLLVTSPTKEPINA